MTIINFKDLRQKMYFFEGIVNLNQDGIKIMFNPALGLIQVNMGGEWWIGAIKIGLNIIKHRKEDIEENYNPVLVSLIENDDEESFDLHIKGGFGMETTFKIGKNLPKNDHH
jgi:hypothetical protein